MITEMMQNQIYFHKRY